MNKTVKLYIVIFILAVIAMLYNEQTKPKPINWFPSFTKKHKIPYGTHVLFQSLPDLFPNSNIESIQQSPYTLLKNKKLNASYLFIDENVNIDNESFYKLMNFVSEGNNVFISTTKFDIDTLGIVTKRLFGEADDTPFFKLYSTSFKNKEYSFDRGFSQTVFTEIDTLKSTIIGQAGFVNKEGERTDSGANFIKHKHGDGYFYLHTFPYAFTNYQILKAPNQKYTAGVLSYLKDPETLFWDSYHKSGKSQISSPMHYILASKSLKWAYFISLIGVLFYIIFEGKRKQRSIRIIKPLKNQTLAFTRTIANMYFEKQEHKNIAEHQIQYFLEYLRTDLHIPTQDLFDDDFQKQLASRSDVSIEHIQKLFIKIKRVYNRNKLTQQDLEELTKLIENFKLKQT